MKIGWATDIHWAHAKEEARNKFIQSVKDAGCQMLFLTGDISENGKTAFTIKFLEDVLDIPIFFVLGNHDFYNDSISETRKLVINPPGTRFSTYLTMYKYEIAVGLESTLIVGHDGWYDGRLGNYQKSTVALNDFYYIKEFVLTKQYKAKMLTTMQHLAQESVDHFKEVLKPGIMGGHKSVIILTHVPPFKENAVYEGRISNDDFLPFFTNKVLGDYLVDLSFRNPQTNFVVLCGHSHGFAEVKHGPNLTVITGDAEYGHPKLNSADVLADFVL